MWIGGLLPKMEETDSSYDKEKLQERLAKLAGGVAVVKVGAATEWGCGYCIPSKSNLVIVLFKETIAFAFVSPFLLQIT